MAESINDQKHSMMDRHWSHRMSSHLTHTRTKSKAARFLDTQTTPAASTMLCQAIQAHWKPWYGLQRRETVMDDSQVCNDY